MNEFLSGFVKRAAQHGLPQEAALDIYKTAISKEEEDEIRRSPLHHKDSTIAGRYLDTKAQRSQAFMEHPFKGTLGGAGGALAGGLGGGAIGGVAGGGLGALLAYLGKGDVGAGAIHGAQGGAGLGGVAGSILGANAGKAMGSQGFSKETRQKNLQETDDKLRHRSTISNAGHSALNMGALSALLGAGVGAYATHDIQSIPGGHYEGPSMLQSALGTGAISGLLGGAMGGLNGVSNSLVHKETSDETHKRTNNLLSKHPISTALPYGDVAGAADS